MLAAEITAIRSATSATCDTFLRQVGEKYPWLHPDYDPRQPVWCARAKSARRRLAAKRPREHQ